MIPFNRHFNENEQDRGLKALFADPDNLSGIFNWVYEGFKMFITTNRSSTMCLPASVPKSQAAVGGVKKIEEPPLKAAMQNTDPLGLKLECLNE